MTARHYITELPSDESLQAYPDQRARARVRPAQLYAGTCAEKGDRRGNRALSQFGLRGLSFTVSGGTGAGQRQLVCDKPDS